MEAELVTSILLSIFQELQKITDHFFVFEFKYFVNWGSSALEKV